MTTTTLQPPSERLVPSILWAALAKVASKEGNRDELSAGNHHSVEVEVVGTIDDEPVRCDVDAVLTVGHDQQKASSVTPDQSLLVANILVKLNPATRDKILRELPEQFAEADGKLPEVPEDLATAAAEMLKRLRAKKTVKSRGPVRCEYRINEQAAPPTIPFPPHVFAGDSLSAQSSVVG